MKRAGVLIFVLAAAGTAQESGEISPLPNAHAHNDYAHKRPLLDALDQGFCSVEADVFFTSRGMLVGHTVLALRAERTLQSLYLDPLRARVKANDGRVHKGAATFYLLIDVKTDAAPTYAALAKILADYADIVTATRDGRTTRRAVTVVVSGNCDRAGIAGDAVRYASIDGRPKDLEKDESAVLVPWVSEAWGSMFQWNGTGAMTEAERTTLRDHVAKAHAQKRLVRFWGTPDSAEAWAEQLAAGVDLINTDRLAELRKYLVK